jgi:xylulokinase
MRVGFFIDPRRYATMGGVLASGASVEWAIENLWYRPAPGSPNGSAGTTAAGGSASSDSAAAGHGPVDYSAVVRAVEKIAAGCDGLLFLPHLRGAGAPAWEPRSRSAFVGLRSGHSREHLMRAVYEGLCYELRILLEAVENSVDVHAPALNTVGGGAKNSVWQRIKADVLGIPVNVPDVKDATSQGAALIAGVGAGVYPNFTEASRATFRPLHRFEPHPEAHRFYEKRFSLYAKLYDSLREVNIGLAESV